MPSFVRTAIVLAASFAAAFPIAARADDARKFLAEQHFTGMKAFRMQIDAKAPKVSSSRVFTYVAPDKLRIDVPASKLAVVVIGQLVWVRKPDGTWQKQKLGPNFTFLKDVQDGNAIAKRIAGMIVTYVGAENLGGTATHVFRLDAPPKKGFLAKSERIWLGVNDGFPRKILQSNGPYSSVATYSSLNAPLSVSGP